MDKVRGNGRNVGKGGEGEGGGGGTMEVSKAAAHGKPFIII